MAHQHHQPFIYSDSYDTNHQDLLSLQAGMEMLAMPSNKNFFTKDEAASWHDYQQQQLSLSLPQQVNNNHYFHNHHLQQQHRYEEETKFHMRSSIYLIPAQELLSEFCSLGGAHGPRKQKPSASASSSSSSMNQSHHPLLSMDMLELQKRKAKLLSMLEEVERRYKRYCEQMRAVVASFEAAAGEGSATVYSTLASKAMSRHFRCLRDGILGQIQATKKAMGEKDPVSPGTTKGETPRLKLLDQCIRQQKVYQQAGVMESSHPWRPQRGLPERSVSILRAWLFEHFLHPYPSDVDKHILARQTGLSRSQVSNWFINARVRLWKPMVEEMYLEETKEQDNQSSQGAAERETSDNNSWPNRNPNPSSSHQDQKPHLHIETGSLSSIINNSASPHSNASGPSHFGAVDLDFSSYNNHCSSSSSRSFRGGVSLTLGLQQHGGEAVGLSFSPASQMFFSREQMEECEPVQFSILDGEEQNLPYRDLMGAQLLHDLAG